MKKVIALFSGLLILTGLKAQTAPPPVVKKETVKTAMEFIHDKIIALSKDRIFDSHKTISEIAYELGFKYPSHFTRLFKNRVGKSPTEYRQHISSN